MVRDFLLILMIFIWTLFLFHCGSSGEASKPPKRVPQLVVLDFYNMSGNSQYNNLSPQFSERLKQELSYYFSTYDPTYVRNYIQRLGYSEQDLYDMQIAREIGELIGVDYVVRGSYNVFGDEVQVIINFTPVDPNQPTYPFEYVLEKDSIFSNINDMAEEIYEQSSSEIPLIALPTEEEMEMEAVTNATNMITLERIVETYVEGRTLEVGEMPSYTPDLLEYEDPSPRPEWTRRLPTAPRKVYFVGQAFEGDNYFPTLEKAIEDAYYQMSMAIGVQIESTTQVQERSVGEEVQREIMQDLIITTLSQVRNSKREATYMMKLTNGLYNVCVLYSLDRGEFRRLIAESIEKQKQLMEIELAQAQNQNTIDRLQAQIDTLEQISENQDEMIQNLQQQQLHHRFQASTQSEVQRSRELEEEFSYYNEGAIQYTRPKVYDQWYIGFGTGFHASFGQIETTDFGGGYDPFYFNIGFPISDGFLFGGRFAYYFDLLRTISDNSEIDDVSFILAMQPEFYYFFQPDFGLHLRFAPGLSFGMVAGADFPIFLNGALGLGYAFWILESFNIVVNLEYVANSNFTRKGTLHLVAASIGFIWF